MAPHTAYFRVKMRTHSRHISEFFWKLTKAQVPIFTPDLRLFKSNTARDEGISTNSQTQHWRPPFSDWQWRHRKLFFFVGLKNLVNLVLFFKPWFGEHWLVAVLVYSGKFLKDDGLQPNFLKWLCFPLLSHLENFISNYWVHNYCCLIMNSL